MQDRRRGHDHFFDRRIFQDVVKAGGFLDTGIVSLVAVERRLALVAQGVQRAEEVEIAGEILAPVTRSDQGEIAGGILYIHNG